MRKYSMELIKKAVEDYLTGSRTQKEVAYEYHISQSLLSTNIMWLSYGVAKAVASVSTLYIPSDFLEEKGSIWVIFDDEYINSCITKDVTERVSKLMEMSPEAIVKLAKIFIRKHVQL